MTPFLTYELLTPETVDPVIIRITGQKRRYFVPFQASNGVVIGVSRSAPQYFAQGEPSPLLIVWSEEQRTWGDNQPVPIPLADWPAVKQGIRELNNEKAKEAIRELIKDAVEDVETWPDWKKNYSLLATCSTTLEPRAKKEKDMKEDTHEYPLSEWEYCIHGGTSTPGTIRPRVLILTRRKKPKVEDRENIPVKVEWSNVSRFGDGMGENGIDFTRHGYERYHIVQFRVTGFAWNDYLEWIRCDGHLAEVSTLLTRQRIVSSFNPSHCENQRHFLYIGLDARDKFSCPVLLPEEVYSRLPEICSALEQKANQGG